jgi:hypothetical protein
MPKTIVIAGGGRNVGKTRLAEALVAILGDAAAIKIGVHAAQDAKNPLFFPAGTRLAEVTAAAGDRAWLVVESGAILDDPDAEVALVIFLPASGGDKPGSERRRARAHMVRGCPLDRDQREAIRGRLGVDEDVLAAIVEAVEASGSAP